MTQQRDRARAAGNFSADYSEALSADVSSKFIGYEQLSGSSSIIALSRKGASVEELKRGEEGSVVLGETPFYAESGGQAGDRGMISIGSTLFEVTDSRKQGSGAIVHIGVMREGLLKIGDQVKLSVDAQRRQAIVLNHSATHLLHAALRQILGDHVTQKGSLVEADRLRFDFSHPDPLTHEELQNIETLVNQHIRANHEVSTQLMNQDDAISAGAMALFGEKYDDEVRVLSMGNFSVELCGGTHANRTGDIGLLKITVETGIAAGIRRIEAATGQAALNYIDQAENELDIISSLVKGSRQDIANKVRSMVDRLRVVDRELEQLKGLFASSQGDELAAKAIEVNGIKVLAEILENADVKRLRETVDQLKNKLGNAAIVLASIDAGKVRLIAGVSKHNSHRIPAGDLVNMVAEQVGGRGGGRADMAQAGGNDAQALPAALASVPEWIEARLN